MLPTIFEPLKFDCAVYNHPPTITKIGMKGTVKFRFSNNQELMSMEKRPKGVSNISAGQPKYSSYQSFCYRSTSVHPYWVQKKETYTVFCYSFVYRFIWAVAWGNLPSYMCIQRRLKSVWLVSSLSAWKSFAYLAIQNASSVNSDQTAHMSEGTFSDVAASLFLTNVLYRIEQNLNLYCINAGILSFDFNRTFLCDLSFFLFN